MAKFFKLAIITILSGLTLAGCKTTTQTASPLETRLATLPGQQEVYQGQEHYKAARYGLAEAKFRKAVETNPQSLDAWLGLAASYDRLRRFDMAARSYKSAMKIGGRTPVVLNNLGYSYMLQGNVTRARRTFLAAQKMDPSNPSIAANLALLEQGVKISNRGA